MTWVYIVLILSSLGFIVYMLVEHRHQASSVLADMQRLQAVQAEAQSKLETSGQARDEAKQRLEAIGQDVQQLQQNANELYRKIRDRRQEMARQGRYRLS